MRLQRLGILAISAISALLPIVAHAAGARQFKSGPIQITVDGRWVWVANADQDSVTRLDTISQTAQEFPLPGPGREAPRGLSVSEDGSEVWVACHDSDRVHVLSGLDGSLIATLSMPWGSGPYSVALSRDQSRALVTLHRSGDLAVIDVPSRTLTQRLGPVFWSPLGIAWMEDGTSAWITHLFADGEDPFLSRVDFSGPQPEVTTKLIVKSTNPKQSTRLAPPNDIAEGGYLTFRGHLAQIPTASGRNRIWIPTQYNNINENRYTPDSTVQSTIRTVELASHRIPNTNADKVILSAKHVHDPAPQAGAYVGPGWDARVSGPVDLAFSIDGSMAWVLFEQSNDVVAMPTNTPAFKPSAATPPLVEISVGMRPLGIAVSPVADRAYVWNSLDTTVSILDLATNVELTRVTLTAQPAIADPNELNGAILFHSSDDPANGPAQDRISSNQKIACASCHPHAEHDGRVWDFQSLPGNHGQRHGMSLLGMSLGYEPVTPGQRGQLHLSGDRDEVQDFDFTFTGVSMGGLGFLGPGANPEIGALNAGISQDMDDLAAYLMSLPPIARSPRRGVTGSLSEAAIRGATFFSGSSPRMPADASCGTCHDPSRGFTDRQFHDVGSGFLRRPGPELELQAFNWTVNTPTLIGVWTTPPYVGVTSYANSLVGVVEDSARAGRPGPSHGTSSGLTGRQLMDLAEFVGSIDGNMTAAEVSGARDVTPPRVTRVEPASPTRIDVWFNESVDPSAASPAAWQVRDSRGNSVAITGATWDGQNGDRITLAVDRLQRGCSQETFTVTPLGPIADMADRATGGVANLLDITDASNTLSFPLADRLTVTMGGSGYENITVRVHEAAVVGSGLPTWSHGSVWLGVNPGNGEVPTGFVRFDWAAAFAAATGVTASSDILDASYTLHPEWGDLNDISVRRVLLPWVDNGHTDFDSTPSGGPTHRDANATQAWNAVNAGAMTAGVNGTAASDYNGTNDTGFTPDVIASMIAINKPFRIGGAGVSDAFRFWFDNPALDFGHALRMVPRGAPTAWYHEAKFETSQAELMQNGPVLTVTYAIPMTATIGALEVSSRTAAQQLRVAREANGALRLRFEDLGARAVDYSVYEGTIGARSADPVDWYSHASTACHAVASPAGGAVELVTPAQPGGRSYLVAAHDACSEGITGSDSFLVTHDPARQDCP